MTRNLTSLGVLLSNVDRFAHGTRARYSAAKCRCHDCRAANTRYENERQKRKRRGDINPLVGADRVRSHLLALSASGIGLRAVADTADVPRLTLRGIRDGFRRFLRADSERRILDVDASAAADHATVEAAPTWRLIRELVEEGYRKGAIAQRLGCKVPALQIRRGRVLAATALRIKKLHAELMGVGTERDDAPVAGRPRDRMLAALSLFDWVTSESLFDAMGIPADERSARIQMLGRLAASGHVDRRGDRPYEYRRADARMEAA